MGSDMGLNLQLKSHFVHSSSYFIDILNRWNALTCPPDQTPRVDFRRRRTPWDVPFKKQNHFLTTCNNNSECSICLNNTVDHLNGGKLIGCNHTFHTNCMSTWLSKTISQNKCPNCRKPVIYLSKN